MEYLAKLAVSNAQKIKKKDKGKLGAMWEIMYCNFYWNVNMKLLDKMYIQKAK